MTGYDQTFQGQGANKAVRARKALEAKMDRESVPGHWIWTAKVNSFGNPILYGGSGMAISASDVVWSQWRGHARPGSLGRQCEHALCVKPGCWAEAPKPVREPRPRAPRVRTPAAERAPRKRRLPENSVRQRQPPLKNAKECAAGHDLSSTLRRYDKPGQSGKWYCEGCRKDKAALRWATQRK